MTVKRGRSGPTTICPLDQKVRPREGTQLCAPLLENSVGNSDEFEVNVRKLQREGEEQQKRK